MLTVAAYWDRTQMDPELEWRIWRQLKGAYGIGRFAFVPAVSHVAGITADFYPDMPAALATCVGHKVFLRLGGTDTINAVPADDDYTIIVGSTVDDLAGLPEVGDSDVELDAINPVDLYGTCAASILLHRMFKRGLFS